MGKADETYAFQAQPLSVSGLLSPGTRNTPNVPERWQGSCCTATTRLAKEKRCRVTESPDISGCPMDSTIALVYHPSITAVEHLIQIARSRPLDGEGFLLFDNTVIRGPLDSPQHPNGYRKVRIVQ